MSALGRKVLDLAEQQGLLDGKAIAELRRQVAESKFVITPQAIAKVLVDHGHLTPFQARKLVSQAQGNEPDPIEQRVVEKVKQRQQPDEFEDLTFADGSTPEPAFARSPDEDGEDDEDVIELEAIDTTPKRAAPKPGGKKPVPAPAPAALEPPLDGSTAEDFVELEPISDSPPARGNRWKTDQSPGAVNETVELTPIDLAAPDPTPAAELVPIDDLFGPDPFAGPKPAPAPRRGETLPAAPDLPTTSPLAPRLTAAPFVAPARPTKNVWDSPLMLLGGGALGIILVAFALLFYALTRGSAAEMFAKAEEEYKNGAYGSAGALYDQFLKSYPDDPNASLARVRRGMGTLRQVTDDGKNPRLGLETARQVLPQIESEEKFAEARSELATILPNVADGFATQASQTQDPTRKQELVKLAGESLALVNNPSYLPASVRKDRESHIARVVDKLKLAERGIEQGKDVAAAVEKISAATDKGDTAAAYQAHADLLRTYPALATSSELLAAIRQVSEKERQLVRVSQGSTAAETSDHAATSERIVIASRDGPAFAAGSARPVFLLLEGAVYGIDAASGRVLWRRFVGYETTSTPLPLVIDGRTDAVAIDGRRQELLRLKGDTGELVWRQGLGDRAFGPVAAGSRLLVTTRKGSVIAVEAATGEIASIAQLPQGAIVAPAVRQSRIYQLGEHSTLFILDTDSLACTETVYVGHKAGAIFVAPAAVLDQVLLVETPADDYSQIQVLSPDAKTKRLVPFGKPLRLKGRIGTPLAVSAARVAAITDLGQVAVYEVDPANAQEHLRLIAGLDASEASPQPAFCELERNRLWVARRRRTLFDVQAALSQLARRWTENHDDAFVAPLQLQGDVLIQARRRTGSSAVLVEGCNAVSGDVFWTTHLAAPIAAIAPSEARQTVDVLTSEGKLYSLRADRFAEKYIEQPTKGAATITGTASLSPDGQTLVWSQSHSADQALIYDVKSGSKPTSIPLPAKAIAPVVPLGSGVIAPLDNGTVAFAAANSTAAPTMPFMPPLMPDALPRWTRPALLPDQTTFLISDGRAVVYAVTKTDRPKPQLAAIGESRSAGPILSPLVAAGSIVFGVVRQEKSDAIVGFNPRGGDAFEPIVLEGRVEAGPFAVGGLAFVAAEPDGLVCFGADGKIRWQRANGELDHGPLAGPLLACGEADLLSIHQAGVVCRLDAVTGKELGRSDLGEPLLGPACVVGDRVLIAGSDGVVHRISIPPRP